MSDESTLELAIDVRAVAARRWPALTVLAHADARRVGDRARLGSGRMALSRQLPLFTAPRGGIPSGLEDRFVSRQPVHLDVDAAGGVTIDPSGSRIEVAVDGVTVDAPLHLPPARVEAGAVLSLSGRVALLLHTLGPGGAATDALGIVGHSEGIDRVRRDILQVADLDVPVLIRGESGAGKELVARAVHEASRRAGRPYEVVNMAAVPASLAASEMFGHARGAFSGAERRHAGFFERADGGTLFLDEVGDTPADVQALLLRVLETGEVQAVGAPRVQTVDVRLVAATDADLEGAAASGDFRVPLLHRLAGFQIRIPALRERRDDIGRLFYHFVQAELAALGEPDRLAANDVRDPYVPPALVAVLAAHPWPGNVRQLRNVARQLVIASRRAPRLEWADLLPRILPAAEAPLAASGPLSTATPVPPAPAKAAAPRYRAPDDVGEDEMLAALRAHGFRLAPTAEALNVSRTTLYALVEQSNKVRKAADLSFAEVAEALAEAGGDPQRAAARLEVSAHALKIRMNAQGIG